MTEIDWMTSCSNRLISHYGYDYAEADNAAERIAEQEIAPLPNVAGPRRFVNAAMTEPLREKPWTPPRG